MSSNLFGTEVPAITDATDAAPYTLGTRFTPSVDGTATHGRWYFPASAQANVTVGIFRVSDQVLLGSKAFAAPTPGAWNQQAFDTPIALSAGVAYVAAVYTPARYVATGTHAWPYTSGDLTAVANNGWFNDSGAQVALTYPPTESGNDSAYFADLVFVPDAEPSAAPDGIALTVSLGAPTVTYPVVTRPGSVSVAVSLGAPFLSVSPTAVAVTVSLGAPATVGAEPERRRRGWDTYGEALRFNYEQAEYDKTRVPVDCPNDGTPLVAGRDGGLRCPFDGWSWPEKRILTSL